MTRVLVLTGHPRRESFCRVLAERYAEGAEAAGHAVRRLALPDLAVDLVPPDYHAAEAAAPAEWVREVQEAIAWAEHWTIVAPMWWGGLPAGLEALFDRVLMPGFAFRYHRDDPYWDRLLAGRSARVVLTMDTPPWVLRWLWSDPIGHRLRRQVLGFCGFDPVAITRIGPVRRSAPAARESWLAEIEALGRRAA